MPKGLQRHADQQENHRQRRQQDGQRDFVGRLLALRPFHQRNHPVQKSLAGIDRDANGDLVRQHARAAGDGAAVPAALANDRGRFARDGRFVHRGRPFDHIAVGGDDFGGAHQDDVSFAEIGGVHLLKLPVFPNAPGLGLDARFAQGLGLGFAAPFRHRFGKIGKQDRKPQPERQLGDESAVFRRREYANGRQGRPGHRHKHDRILEHQPGIELLARIQRRRPGDVPVK